MHKATVVTEPVYWQHEYKICVLPVLVLLLKDAVPLGEIILGPHGCWVDETFPEKMEHNANMFMLHVPNRPRGGFPLMVESLISKKAWMDAIQSVIDNCRGSSDLHSSQSTYEKEASDENGASS